jgi:surface carbohydrate biosynthesis protein (TIGR04326 family)
LTKKNIKINWTHHFARHALIRSEVAALKVLSDFNKNSNNLGTHLFLHNMIGVDLIIGVIFDYAKLYLSGLKLGDVTTKFKVTSSNINVWPLVRADWNDSLYGAVAMQNCIFLNSFELLFRLLPHQKFGLYLMENQSWEKALLYSWKSAGFGDIVGVPHTQINFWDLRFFKESFNNDGKFDSGEPRPDYVALNGPPAISLLQNTSYSPDEVIGVEALRFNYLQEFVGAPKLGPSESSVKKILILGDISEQVTCNQLKILADSITYLLGDYSFVLRLHPACPINLDQFKLKNLTLSSLNESLADLLKGADLVYTSNSTSAAIEAYSANLPVISVYDEDGFNMSPLKKIGAIYVNSGVQLAKAIIETKARSGTNPPYFYLDKNLGRWEKLINFLNR